MPTARLALTSLAVLAFLFTACSPTPPAQTPGGEQPTPGGEQPTPGGEQPTPGGETPGNETPAAQPTPGGQTGARLGIIQSRGSLICGVNTNLPGFGYPEEGTGRWLGFDADFCRVVATAVLGDPNAVEFRALSADDRGPALSTGEIDVLIRNTTWTLTRDTEWGLFGPTTFYDGQGVMVRTDSGVGQLTDFQGLNPTICVQSGTTTELTLPDQMRALGVEYTQDTRPDIDQTYAVYEAGDCDAVTSDVSQLIARRTLFSDPDAHTILPDIMSKEPLGPVVPFGDERWFNVVKWATWATMQAEELGIDSSNVAEMRDTSTDPVVRRLLGVEGGLGTKLGLSDDWAFNIISEVGNYEEIFNEHLGPGTPFNLERGLNALWTDGGLLYPPAWR
jgi:general L-amino acid transport system substrate-binding protein